MTSQILDLLKASSASFFEKVVVEVLVKMGYGGSCKDAGQAIEWKWGNHRPAKINRLKEGSGRIVYLTTAQVSELLVAAAEHQSPFIYPFIMITLETAMRRSEILSVRLEHIDLQRRIIFIPQAKAGAREQPITRNLSEYLAEYLKTIEPGQVWLFPSARSK